MSIDSEPQRTAQTASLSARLGMEIKLEMVRAGISGRRLAIRLGVSQTWVSTRTTGATPIDVNELENIADALGVPVAELLSRAVSSKPRGVNLSFPRLTVPAAPADDRPIRVSPFGGGRTDSVRPASAVPATKRRPARIGSSTRPRRG
jgi:transcriptional regulator with XRE-family HTH domain